MRRFGWGVRPFGLTTGVLKKMQLQLSRRRFLGTAGVGIAATSMGAFGFGGAEAAMAASIKPFRLTGTTETRNTCPYCSVACGIIM